jgi:hypothetical protein
MRPASSSSLSWPLFSHTALFRSLCIEHSLDKGLAWGGVEPNDEPLWARIRAEAGAFLDDLFHRSAFCGTTPRDAYFVRCDRDTTSQDDVDKGAINVLVGFAPARPAEFVTLTIRLCAPAT